MKSLRDMKEHLARDKKKKEAELTKPMNKRKTQEHVRRLTMRFKEAFILGSSVKTLGMKFGIR